MTRFWILHATRESCPVLGRFHGTKSMSDVGAGGEAVIARAVKPVVRLVRVDDLPQRRVIGQLHRPAVETGVLSINGR